MLHTTSGILLAEPIYRAELSNFLDLTLKKNKDPYPITLVIAQLPTGNSKSILTRYNFPPFFPNLTCVYCVVACSHNFGRYPLFYVNDDQKGKNVFAVLGG